ncbi:MAG: alpha/beta hydrolase [Dethiobacteria bacterium]|jgi:putative tributyrin esterase
MALIRLDHVSENIKVNLPLNMIVPDPGSMGTTPVRKRKVLYLLHGLSDDASAWQRYSSIEPLANAYGLVVVMPSAGRSFYSDLPNGQLYFTYLTGELPRYLADLFGLAPERKDTFIAGNSMGGYGAFKAALLRPELYGAAASFSGMLSLEFLKYFPDDPRMDEFSRLFGTLEDLPGGEHDPITWLKKAAARSTGLPRLFMATARQEDLYPLNVIFKAAAAERQVEVDYHEADGRHDWFFWDIQIRRFLAAILGPLPRE